MPDGLAEQTTAAEREGVGVEKFALVCGLAEWKTTIVLTRPTGSRPSWISLPPPPALAEHSGTASNQFTP